MATKAVPVSNAINIKTLKLKSGNPRNSLIIDALASSIDENSEPNDAV
jgi:hypothetical protein